MSHTKNILLVTNGIIDNEINQIRNAFIQAEKKHSPIKLQLVHVIPNFPICYFNIPSMSILAEQYYNEATQILSNLGQSLHIHKKNQWLMTGRVRTEVLHLAHQLKTHFILVSGAYLKELHQSPFNAFKRNLQSTPTVRSINSLINAPAA